MNKSERKKKKWCDVMVSLLMLKRVEGILARLVHDFPSYPPTAARLALRLKQEPRLETRHGGADGSEGRRQVGSARRWSRKIVLLFGFDTPSRRDPM